MKNFILADLSGFSIERAFDALWGDWRLCRDENMRAGQCAYRCSFRSGMTALFFLRNALPDVGSLYFPPAFGFEQTYPEEGL